MVVLNMLAPGGKGLQRRNAIVTSLLVLGLLTIVEVTLFSFQTTNIPIVSAVETTNSIGVYWDENCQNQVGSLDWGSLYPGATRSRRLYVRNECNESLVLNITSENWLPLIAQQDITLASDYPCGPICKNQVTPITLVLSVSPKITGITSFKFDLTINQQNFAFGEAAEEKILGAPEKMVFFIYTDPAYMGSAEATYDGTAGEIVRSLCVSPQHYGFNTTKNWLLPSGAINTTTIHDSTILLFGGRMPNIAVNYYETVKCITPVTCEIYGDRIYFENRTGTLLGSISLSVLAAPKYHEDLFTAMVFYDEAGSNTFFLMYGMGWKGTWASGIYFKEVMSKNLEAYTNQYYVFSWVDDNQQDGIPQTSEIHIIC